MINISKEVFDHVLHSLDVAHFQIIEEINRADMRDDKVNIEYLNHELMINKFARDTFARAKNLCCFTLISDFEKSRL